MSRYEAEEQVTAGPAADGPAGPAVERREEPVTGLAGGLRMLPRRAALRAGLLAPRWRITSIAVLGVLVAGAGLTAARLAAEARHGDAVTRARTAALAAATTDIRHILSYDYRSIHSDLARARNDTTGEFRGEFGVLASQLIGPAAAQQHTITWATVPHAAVVSATADQVVVLLFIDQRTASRAQPQPQLTASQIQVTMQRAGGRWRVARFQAL